MDSISERNRSLVARAATSHSAQPQGSMPRGKVKYASPKDWNDRIREAVTKLYVLENKPLKEVISIMAKEYGHYATKRMYLSRIQEWDLFKNKKESDMTFILHKSQQRLALGKETTFVVRGQQVGFADAHYYFERKKTNPKMATLRPTTPPHILYRTPSPPSRLLLSEKLFIRVKEYYDLSYTSRVWEFKDALCVDVRTGGTEVPNLDEFLASCQSATNLIESKSFVEARRLLSTGFNLIRPILEQEHPSALYYILEALCRLKRRGLHEIDVLIRSYMGKMCNIILRQADPWSDIWRLLGVIDSNDIDDVMLQCWKCANDSAELHLGRFDPWTISNIIDRNHMYLMNDSKEEVALKSFLLECEKMPVGNGKATARAKILYNLGNCLEKLERYAEEEPVSLELAAYGRVIENPIEELRGVVLAATAQAKLGKEDLAEANYRRSILLIDKTEALGPKSPWAVQQLGRLEEFLRSVKREEDAETVKTEIKSRLKRHDIDAELDNTLGGHTD